MLYMRFAERCRLEKIIENKYIIYVIFFVNDILFRYFQQRSYLNVHVHNKHVYLCVYIHKLCFQMVYFYYSSSVREPLLLNEPITVGVTLFLLLMPYNVTSLARFERKYHYIIKRKHKVCSADSDCTIVFDVKNFWTKNSNWWRKKKRKRRL